MDTRKCLNCDNQTINNFCSVCGQKNSTHRFSLSHIVLHDFIHGIFHLDKGFLFTIKELFTRPGHSIREYIQGKRVKHFNYFTLLIILITIEFVIRSYSSVTREEIFGKEEVLGYSKIVDKYNKIIRLISIPLWALITWLLFRKTKQTFMENVVLNLYMMSALLLIYSPVVLVSVFVNNIIAIQIVGIIANLIMFIYVYWFVYQYFSVFTYKKLSLIFLSLLTTLLILIIQNGFFKIVNQIGLLYFH